MLNNRQEEESEQALLSASSLTSTDDLHVDNVSFSYQGPNSEQVLKSVNLVIAKGKTTAIVGMSGSGKTALLKILLKFYNPVSGEIRVGTKKLQNIRSKDWRAQCGAVLQDGYLFSDTIARNVALRDEFYNEEKPMRAIELAKLTDYVNSLPLGVLTKIGENGQGIS